MHVLFVSSKNHQFYLLGESDEVQMFRERFRDQKIVRNIPQSKRDIPSHSSRVQKHLTLTKTKRLRNK